MPAFYTVVQFVPDPIADERINVGVIVFGDGQIRSRFLQNWDRVRRFAQQDIDHVREFADWIGQAAVKSASGSMAVPLPGFPVTLRADEATIRRIAAEWSNSIQLTSPQPSLEDPDPLLIRMAQTYLREPAGRSKTFRDRQFAARSAVRTVRKAVSDRFGATEADHAVHSDYEIGGRVVPSIRVDLAIANSRIYVASQTLSFETYNMSDLDRQVRDAVYTLRDVSDLAGNIQLDLVAFPPKPELKNYRKASEKFREIPAMCRQIGARLVLEDQMPEWAEQLADLVGSEIVQHELREAHA